MKQDEALKPFTHISLKDAKTYHYRLYGDNYDDKQATEAAVYPQKCNCYGVHCCLATLCQNSLNGPKFAKTKTVGII